MSGALREHLQSGVTTTCRCWALTRQDGVRLGFTDHDGDLSFDGLTFRADTGLTAMALERSTGLAVDNTDAIGVLSDSAVREADIIHGRYDGAEVLAWLVNWSDPVERRVIFRGHIGAIRRAGGRFEAELRGLAQGLNQPMGRVYQKPCGAVLGDRACGVDLTGFGLQVLRPVEAVSDNRVFRFDWDDGPEPGWFGFGRVRVESGVAAGQTGLIRSDLREGGLRVISLWQPLRAPVAVGDTLRIEAGCDKRMATCRDKFQNLRNFRGFPDLPGDDLLIAHGSRAPRLDGGSRR